MSGGIIGNNHQPTPFLLNGTSPHPLQRMGMVSNSGGMVPSAPTPNGGIQGGPFVKDMPPGYPPTLNVSISQAANSRSPIHRV